MLQIAVLARNKQTGSQVHALNLFADQVKVETQKLLQ